MGEGGIDLGIGKTFNIFSSMKKYTQGSFTLLISSDAKENIWLIPGSFPLYSLRPSFITFLCDRLSLEFGE